MFLRDSHVINFFLMYLQSDSESEKLSNTENEKKTYSVKSIDGTEEISDACQGTSCNRDDDIHMVNKKQDIEGWIAQQQLISAVDDKSFSTNNKCRDRVSTTSMRVILKFGGGTGLKGALARIIKYLDSLSLNGSYGDSCTLDMLLATLQKMSLRKQQRVYMVEANLIEWLLHHLASTASAESDDICAISAYRLEYAAALLMNLSLQSEARVRASALSPVLISTLKNLLSLDRAQLIPYANGALQNFLLNNVINEAARNDNLADFLNWLYEQVRAEFRDQILRTLRIHLREHYNDLSDDEDEDDLSNEDDYEILCKFYSRDKSSDEKSFADEINAFQAKPRIMRTPPGSFKRKTSAVAAAEEKEKLSEIT
ncbi:unnamed protein product [Trichogramma brassicae]|uniref:LisH domain-containing protein n=1 Tax=Trichogramma brassicae TaxID=86971 RepID=A0A6H5IY48_9HYME|nr:unnamed protein product [Trichogramma brassicae]